MSWRIITLIICASILSSCRTKRTTVTERHTLEHRDTSHVMTKATTGAALYTLSLDSAVRSMLDVDIEMCDTGRIVTTHGAVLENVRAIRLHSEQERKGRLSALAVEDSLSYFGDRRGAHFEREDTVTTTVKEVAPNATSRLFSVALIAFAVCAIVLLVLRGIRL